LKFPFDFSLSLVFRLLFPGMVLAAVMWPVIAVLLSFARVSVDAKLGLPIAAVMFGWFVVLADQPIYILYEGRSWWPAKYRKRAIEKLSKQLSASSDLADKLYAEGDPRNIEYYIRELDFPLDKDGRPYAASPTRLGNIVEAFETYSNSVYGIDAIFYWPRLWIMLDKDLRNTLDESQAVADGALYVSFSLLLGLPIVFAYAVGGWLSFHPGWRLFDLPDLPGPFWTSLTFIVMLLLSRATYELCLWQQRVYGDLFRSLFDQFQDKLAFVDNAASIAVALGTNRQLALDNKFGVAALLLRWHRIHPSGESDTMTPEAWAEKKNGSSLLS